MVSRRVPLVLALAGSLTVVSVSSPALVSAAGRPVAAATPPGGTFASVSCVSSSDCMAVGNAPRPAGSVKGNSSLAEVWNGLVWTVKKTPDPVGAVLVQVGGVSCAAANYCVMVGNYDDANGNAFPLAEIWNGSTWTIAKTAVPKSPAPRPDAMLYGASCPEVGSCVAVGGYTGSGGLMTPVVESGGSSFTIATNSPPAKVSSQLSAVSCSSSSTCTAVGYVMNSPGSKAFNFAEDLTAFGWKVETIPPGTTTDNLLQSVSCVSSSACVAVGYAGSAAVAISLASWNGKAWSLAKLSPPAHSTTSNLGSVSCLSASSCTVAGGYSIPSGAELPLADSWSDAALKLLPEAPRPSGSPSADFVGISCKTGKPIWCQAVGTYVSAAGESPLAEIFNGKTWSFDNPTSTTQPK